MIDLHVSYCAYLCQTLPVSPYATVSHSRYKTVLLSPYGTLALFFYRARKNASVALNTKNGKKRLKHESLKILLIKRTNLLCKSTSIINEHVDNKVKCIRYEEMYLICIQNETYLTLPPHTTHTH